MSCSIPGFTPLIPPPPSPAFGFGGIPATSPPPYHQIYWYIYILCIYEAKKKTSVQSIDWSAALFSCFGGRVSPKSDIYDLSMRICIQIQSHVLKMSTRLQGVSVTHHHLIIEEGREK